MTTAEISRSRGDNFNTCSNNDESVNRKSTTCRGTTTNINNTNTGKAIWARSQLDWRDLHGCVRHRITAPTTSTMFIVDMCVFASSAHDCLLMNSCCSLCAY